MAITGPQITGQPVTSARLNDLWRQGVQQLNHFPSVGTGEPAPVVNDHTVRTDLGWSEWVFDGTNWLQITDGIHSGGFPTGAPNLYRAWRNDQYRRYIYASGYPAWLPMGGARITCRAVLSTASASIPAGAGNTITIPWNANDDDSGDGIHVTSGATNTRMTAVYTGHYRFNCTVGVNTFGTGAANLNIEIFKNGTIKVASNREGPTNFVSSAIGEYFFLTGDYIETKITNNTGGAIQILVPDSFFLMTHSMTF